MKSDFQDTILERKKCIEHEQDNANLILYHTFWHSTTVYSIYDNIIIVYVHI